MRDLIILLIHAVATLMRVFRRRCAGRCRRIRSRPTSIVNYQPFSPARPESPRPGSNCRGLLLPVDSAAEASSGGNRVQDIDVLGLSSRDGAA
jgi:hypothetical protein